MLNSHPVSNGDPSKHASEDHGTREISSEREESRIQRDQSALRSIAWSGASRYAGQGFRWACTFVVARILSPEDYGLVGMTTLFSGLVSLIAEFGVGASVIRMHNLDDEQLAQLNGLAVVLGAVAMLVGFLCAWPLGLFFQRDEVVAIVAVSSVGFLLSSLQTVPAAVLQRATEFRTIAGIEFTGALLLAILVLLFAICGAGYWALVLPSLAVGAFNSFRFWRRSHIRLAWPRLSQIHEAYRYSVWVISGRLSGYVFSNADFVIVGRLLGSNALGAYSMAWDLANTANDQINGLIARVSAPYFSQVQRDRDEVVRLFTLMLEAVACISLPIVLGLSVVAPEFVAFVLGSKWRDSSAILQLLCIVAALRVGIILLNPLMAMLGDARYQARFSFASLLLVPPILIAGGMVYGTMGVAGAWLVVYPAIVAVLFRRAARMLGTSTLTLLSSLLPGGISSVSMVLVVLATKAYLPLSIMPVLRLGILVGTGAFTYFVVLFTLYPSRVAAFRQLVTNSFGKSAR